LCFLPFSSSIAPYQVFNESNHARRISVKEKIRKEKGERTTW